MLSEFREAMEIRGLYEGRIPIACGSIDDNDREIPPFLEGDFHADVTILPNTLLAISRQSGTETSAIRFRDVKNM